MPARRAHSCSGGLLVPVAWNGKNRGRIGAVVTVLAWSGWNVQAATCPGLTVRTGFNGGIRVCTDSTGAGFRLSHG